MKQLLIEFTNKNDLDRQLCLTETEWLVGVKDGGKLMVLNFPDPTFHLLSFENSLLYKICIM